MLHDIFVITVLAPSVGSLNANVRGPYSHATLAQRIAFRGADYHYIDLAARETTTKLAREVGRYEQELGDLNMVSHPGCAHVNILPDAPGVALPSFSSMHSQPPKMATYTTNLPVHFAQDGARGRA